MHLDVCYISVICSCAGRFRLGWAHDIFFIACHMFMHSHAYVLSFQYILIYLNCLRLFWLSSLSLHLFVYVSLLLWHPNLNLLRLGTLFVPGHLLLLTLPLSMSGSLMRRPDRTSLRTFPDEAFIQNATSSCRTSSTLTFPLSFAVRVGSHCVMSRSHVHSCWSRSSTPTCMDSIFQYLISLLAFEVCTLLSHRRLSLMCSVSLG